MYTIVVFIHFQTSSFTINYSQVNLGIFRASAQGVKITEIGTEKKERKANEWADAKVESKPRDGKK